MAQTKPPVIVRILAWLSREPTDGELITYLDDQRRAAESSAARIHRRRGFLEAAVFPPSPPRPPLPPPEGEPE